jgi:hypothetical protein
MECPMPDAKILSDSWVFATRKKLEQLLEKLGIQLSDLSGGSKDRRKEIIGHIEGYRASATVIQSLKLYNQNEFGLSTDYIKHAAIHFPMQLSTKWLTAIRCGMFPSTKRLAHMECLLKELPSGTRALNTEVCPWCEAPGSAETNMHLCIECPKFSHLRDNLGPIILNISGNAQPDKNTNKTLYHQHIMTVV